MALLTIKSSVEEIDQQAAGGLLIRAPYERQRPLREWRVDELTQIMRSGEFSQSSQIKVGILDGVEHLLNGRHRLTAIHQSGLAQTFVVTRIEVETMEDLHNEYITEDRPLTRSWKDIAQAQNLEQRLHLSKQIISRMMGAIKFIERGFTGGRVRLSDRATFLLLEQYAYAAETYFRLIGGATVDMKGPLAPAATLSVGLFTLHHAPQSVAHRVHDFWRGVAMPYLDTWPEADPRVLCYVHLRTTFMPGTTSAMGSHIRHPAYSARYIAACFNEWMLGGEFQEPTISDELQPIVIAFSPLKAAQQIVGVQAKQMEHLS
jgi:hypothetical protein